MKDGGCHAVVLGCTEFPLIRDNSNSRLPTLDSTRLLARAARSAVQGEHRSGVAAETLPVAGSRDR
jgi:aspartate racemase